MSRFILALCTPAISSLFPLMAFVAIRCCFATMVFIRQSNYPANVKRPLELEIAVRTKT